VYIPQGVPELEAAVTLGAWALGLPWHKPNQPTNSLSNRHDAQIHQFVHIYLFYYCYMILDPCLSYFVLLCIFCYTDILLDLHIYVFSHYCKGFSAYCTEPCLSLLGL
jgi:hypothetical protein